MEVCEQKFQENNPFRMTYASLTRHISASDKENCSFPLAVLEFPQTTVTVNALDLK